MCFFPDIFASLPGSWQLASSLVHLQLNERRRRSLQFLHHCLHLHCTASTASTSSTHIALHWLLSISQLIVAQRIHTRVFVSFLSVPWLGIGDICWRLSSPLSRNVHSPPTRTSTGTHKVAGPLLIWWRRCHLGREGVNKPFAPPTLDILHTVWLSRF